MNQLNLELKSQMKLKQKEYIARDDYFGGS